MKILNVGSLNIDDVYSVNHFVKPGETISSTDFKQFCGGKGLNQSIALANAGAEVFHAGAVGKDGIFLKERLEKAGVNTSLVKIKDTPTGKAIIQLVPQGENCIILFKGANHSISDMDIEEMLSKFNQGDIILLQNEINNIEKIINKAYSMGLTIALNPAPMEDSILRLPLNKIGIFIVNEIEGEGFTGKKLPEEIGKAFSELYPKAKLVLTLGEKGVYYRDKETVLRLPAEKIKAVDTTAAGDTFIGYFLAGIADGDEIGKVLKKAVKASAITCTKIGAADSIPFKLQVK